LWANVISRVEFRWDHVEHGKAFDITPQGDVAHDNAYLLALNLIYQF
jgi:4-hydroxy-L-threonine phosphate dehydrogenase PdxA